MEENPIVDDYNDLNKIKTLSKTRNSTQASLNITNNEDKKDINES